MLDEENLDKLFNMFDTSGDGVIDSQELKAVFMDRSENSQNSTKEDLIWSQVMSFANNNDDNG